MDKVMHFGRFANQAWGNRKVWNTTLLFQRNKKTKQKNVKINKVTNNKQASKEILILNRNWQMQLSINQHNYELNLSHAYHTR